MFLRIDSSTGLPIWQQIVAQVTRQIISGRHPAGERLPTVRELAGELRVNPNTVAKAYQELERNGVVETRRGLGTFACNIAGRAPRADNLSALADRIDGALVEAIQLGIDIEALRDLFEERMRALNMNKPDSEDGISREATAI